MEILVAKNSSFCFGVRLAVEAAYDTLERDGGLLMLGEIVHNPTVTRRLTEGGGVIIDGIGDIPADFHGTLLIRAHGVPAETERALAALAEGSHGRIRVADKTCPKVKHVHSIVEAACKRGCGILIVGDPRHPEVIGIDGHATTPARILNDPATAEETLLSLRLHPDFSGRPLCLVAQTTFHSEKFARIAAIAEGIFPAIEIHNTICKTTADRQKETAELAGRADAVIIIGGRSSSNSRKLWEIASRHCPHCVQIEDAEELTADRFPFLGDRERLSNAVIAVCSGSSTPPDTVEAVVRRLRDISDQV